MAIEKTLHLKALNLLARRDHCKVELQRKLQQKNPDTDSLAIESVVNNLEQKGLLSETRYIKNYIQFRREKGFGPLRIRAELLQRGASEESIDDNLTIKDQEWNSAIYKLWQKKYKSNYPENLKMRAQQMRFLISRGYTQEQISQLFSAEKC